MDNNDGSSVVSTPQEMVSSISPANSKTELLRSRKKGGIFPTIFIYVMLGLDSIGFVANMVSLVLYFIYVIHFDLSGSATTLTNYLGTTFMLTLLGGFISDTYMKRLHTTLMFGMIQTLGYMLLTIQAHYSRLQPDACVGSSCIKGTKALMFYGSIYLLALGGGGIRGSLPALGADQFSEAKEKKHIASFFNWMLLSITLGATFGVTIVVWVSMNKGWDLGFFISMLASISGLCILASGKLFFRGRLPGQSPLIRVLQVLVAAIRNRKLSLPENSDKLYEVHDKEAALDGRQLFHTDQFRFLDKAAVLLDGSTLEPWKACTVTQVEEVKILTRMMPIIASTILMNTCLAQLQTFSIQQGTLMNCYIGKFQVPSASIPVIPMVFMTIGIPMYEFLFVPLIRRFTGNPNGITHLQRVGVGLVLSAISMGIAGIIEVKRRNAINHHGEQITVFWLSFQFGIFGIADMFTLVGLMEFFYSEAPAGMRSLSTSFSWLSLSIGYFLSSAFVELTDLVSSKLSKSKRGWLQGKDMNTNHVEYFYWFLGVLSCINFGAYLLCASWYKYKKAISESMRLAIGESMRFQRPFDDVIDEHGTDSAVDFKE